MAQLDKTSAIMAGMTAQHIATNLEAYEAARSGFFVFEIAPSEMTNLLETNYTGGIADPDAANHFMDSDFASKALRLNVVQTSVPHFDITPHQFVRGNDVVNFAGVPKFGNGSIAIDDLVGLDTKSVLMAWQRLAYDPNTFKGGRMKDYKKTCTLMEYTQDYELIRSWTLYGCFITTIQEDEFNKENDGKRTLRATLVYDRAIMKLPEEELE